MKNAQEYIDTLINKSKIYALNLSNQELTGEMNLNEFTNLTNINADNNHFDSLDWLMNLPNKEKIKWLNLWGNKISNVNFALLIDNFPNAKINLENNPLSGDNLKDLNNQQFSCLVEWINSGKLKINSWKGKFLLDLLNYTKQLKEEISVLKEQDNQRELIAQQLQETRL